MAALDLMASLEQMPLSVAIAKSAWLFPIIETLHVLAFSIVVGSIAMLDMRLLGVGFMSRSITDLMRSVLPWTWSGFGAAASCGLLLFSSKASTYYPNLPFRIKMLCLVLAAANMLVFHLVNARGIGAWDVGAPPLRVRATGAASLSLWVAIVAAGRWIGFTT
jgi:uncharacterized membrane protein